MKAPKYLISDLTIRIKMKLLLALVNNSQLQEAGQAAGLINEMIAIAVIQSKVQLQCWSPITKQAGMNIS